MLRHTHTHTHTHRHAHTHIRIGVCLSLYTYALLFLKNLQRHFMHIGRSNGQVISKGNEAKWHTEHPSDLDGIRTQHLEVCTSPQRVSGKAELLLNHRNGWIFMEITSMYGEKWNTNSAKLVTVTALYESREMSSDGERTSAATPFL